ncbi:MAG: acetyl-CoA carboxylase biotin carboxyl carrier protein subunit [Chitinophagales bacterium]
MGNTYKITVNGKHIFETDGSSVPGMDAVADLVKLDDRFYNLLLDQKGYNIEVVQVDQKAKTVVLRVNGNTYTAEVKDRFDQLLEQMGFSGDEEGVERELRAPMPGLVLEIRVALGQEVAKGDPVIVLEAMKMENVLKASGAGKVRSIETTKGKSVEKNQVLITFE